MFDQVRRLDSGRPSQALFVSRFSSSLTRADCLLSTRTIFFSNFERSSLVYS